MCAGEDVSVGEIVRGCQGDRQACASLQEDGGTVPIALACAVEGHEAVILWFGGECVLITMYPGESTSLRGQSSGYQGLPIPAHVASRVCVWCIQEQS